MSTLMHKAGRIKHVAMSHPDRDHVYGLFQLNHHAADLGLVALFYPQAAGAFKAMQEFCYRFDSETRDAYPWVQVKPGDTYDLGRNLGLKVVSNTHIPIEGKSVGYVVERLFRKLKPEYQALSQADLQKLGSEKGSDSLTEPQTERILGYSGDTGPCAPGHWAGCKVLIHEATFLREEDVESERTGYQHSTLPDVLQMAKESGVERLVLGHFSSRYHRNEIASTVQGIASDLELPCSVSAIFPGETVRDVFARPSVYEPQSQQV